MERRHFLSGLIICATVVSIFFMHRSRFTWIIQIRQHLPSHVVVPKIHNNVGMNEQELLNCLANGRHVQHQHPNASVLKVVRDTLDYVWKSYGIPLDLTRADGKCGNLNNGGGGNGGARALCDPKGSKPCCFNYKCESKAVNDCVCPTCWDMRPRIHPEVADYVLYNNSCRVIDLKRKNACTILKEKNITGLMVVGDSLWRHIYQAFLIQLRNDPEYGALDDKTNEDIRKVCKGMKQFTEKVCRNHVQETGKVCNGTVEVRLNSGYRVGYLDYAVKHAQGIPHRTFVINSVGIHDNYKGSFVINGYIKPFLKTLEEIGRRYTRKNTTVLWPKYLWVTPPLSGLLKSTSYPLQTPQHVANYAAETSAYLLSRDVKVLNTLNYSTNVFSWDGTHYGRTYNMELVRLILTYIDGMAEF